MVRRLPLVLVPLTLFGLLSVQGAADGPAIKAAGPPREILATFDKDDPGWKVRMRSLVRIANLGADAVPSLVAALKNGSSNTREFAVQALRLMGPLEPAERWEKLRSDPDRGVRSTVAGALDCKDQPSPEAVRQAYAGYDLTKLDSARIGELAPDFTLASLREDASPP